MTKPKKFSAALYNTGKYKVETRSGLEVKDIEILDYGIAANIPKAIDCRGRFRYGYLHNGKRTYDKKDALDLVLVKK